MLGVKQRRVHEAERRGGEHDGYVVQFGDRAHTLHEQEHVLVARRWAVDDEDVGTYGKELLRRRAYVARVNRVTVVLEELLHRVDEIRITIEQEHLCHTLIIGK